MDDKALCERALAWAAEDADLADAAQLEAWVNQGDMEALRACMSGHLRFGTAGLRGVVGPGSQGMNTSVVRKASLGLARYLKKQVKDAQTRGIVLGRDVRKRSETFVMEAAGVFLAEGFHVFFWEEPCPTPLVPFALLQVKAAAGVMVTASHNPAAYNGYKVYWENGAQMIPPHEEGIAAEMLETGPAKEIRTKLPGGERWTLLGTPMKEAYIKKALDLRLCKHPAPLKIAYTAMHGVGAPWVQTLLREAGYTSIHPLPSQCRPDTSFPTVSSPNPEEPQALSLATAFVEETQADLLLANDPDADRLAAGARDARGKFRLFSGNELGVMLGHYLLSQKPWQKPLLLSTVVSTSLLKRICEALGARHEETLTGFKWIANRALELNACEFVFGFEEAIGYGAGDVVRDKDGISMALLVADLASHCVARGMTLVDYLEQIFRRFGFYAFRQKTLHFSGVEAEQKRLALMNALRKNPPRRLGGLDVVSTSDYRAGVCMETLCLEGSESKRLGLPSAELLSFALERGHRVLVRPSGTEPKLKIYMEWCEPLQKTEALEKAALRAQESLCCLEEDCLRQWFSPNWSV